MRRYLPAAALVGILPLVLSGSPAFAGDSGDVTVANTETVQARLDATGRLRTALVYEQLALSGKGKTTIDNPVSTKGLRNLDGFGGFQVKDGHMVAQVDVDGERRLRTVSQYTKDLPLSVAVSYQLDGKDVKPGDVVGKSGELTVRYTVKNLTGEDREITFDDGKGGTGRKTVTTVVPMIGQLVTTLPPSFTNVRSEEAGMAGDGHGGTRMTFQMTLFPPIGTDTAEFGYTARISRGVVPKASLTSMPVSPLDYPSFKGGAKSYASGAQSGVDLTSGAIQIDDNLLRLHDGAAELLAGLIQLRDGAAQLSEGLNDEAAPGARELANGLGGKLAPGAATLANGLNKDAKPGAAALAAGAKRLDESLAEAGAKAPLLIGGLGQVGAGLDKIDAGLTALYGGIATLPDQAADLHTGLQGAAAAAKAAKTGASQILAGLDSLRTKISVDAPGAPSAITQVGGLHGALTSPTGLPAYGAAIADPTARAQYLGTLAVMADGVASLITQLQDAATGLGQMECGMSKSAMGGSVCPDLGVLDALTGLADGLPAADDGVTALTDGVIATVQGAIGGLLDAPDAGTFRGGVNGLQAGVGELTTKGSALVDGLGQLSTGAGQLHDGAVKLSAGIDKAASGSAQIAGGLGTAATGSKRLADGLAPAADGAAQLADGLTTASEGAPQIVDGTKRLSDEGSSQLAAAGEKTAESFGSGFAVLEVGAARATEEGMAYGAPQGAVGATAYSIEIDGADGSGFGNVARGLVALLVFAAGAGAAVYIARRRVV